MIKRWLVHLGIQQKFFVAMSFGFVGFLLYILFNFQVSAKNQEIMTDLVEGHLPQLEAAEQLTSSISSVKTAVVKSGFSAGMEDMIDLEAAHKRVHSSFQKLNGENDLASNEELFKARQRYDSLFTKVNDSLQTVIAGIATLPDIQGDIQKAARELEEMEEWSAQFKESQTAAFRSLVDRANYGSQKASFSGLVLLLGAIPFAIFFFYLTRNVSRGLRDISDQLTDVSSTMLKVSRETSVSSSKLASSATQQSSAVMESVSSMDQMKTKLSQTVRHSADALRSSEESYKEAADGKMVIDNLRRAMTEIQTTSQSLEEVNEVVRLIREKTNIINEIVFKTQLLSFNASIEAARAGQHGRGFSVVAAEVGKLAETSGGAAQEIGKLLDHSTKKVAEIIGSTKDKVGMANEMSEQCATVFERITDRAAKVNTMVNSITDAASDQEDGIQQVGRAMNEMKLSAEDSDQMAQAISNLSHLLKDHSESLASTVEKLDSMVHGAKSAPQGGLGRKSGFEPDLDDEAEGQIDNKYIA